MKITHVSLSPTEAAIAAGRPALTPELLAATGARYSRSNEGLEAILAQVDPAHPDKSVDRIFKFVDYGHQSIADMVPVALFIDGVSLFLAYYLWTLCPTAGGQESSTRYINIAKDGLVDPAVLGISPDARSEWQTRMERAFTTYHRALETWERTVVADPDQARIPRSLQSDTSEKAKRAVGRMRRNYAFDRARYFLPVATKTNVMMVQSARAWVGVIQNLLSHPLLEAQTLGAHLRDELVLSAPRLLRHAQRQETTAQGLLREFESTRAQSSWLTVRHLVSEATDYAHEPTPHLDVLPPSGMPDTMGARFAADLTLVHVNRYAYVGETLRRTAVRFSWEAVALAELRDLNRHRTGTKYCPLVPVGFYHAVDQLPVPDNVYQALGETGREASNRARALLQNGDLTYVYHTLLGTQYSFEHTTTADKFIYEAELRTGTGAHFRYADHLREILQLWYARYPETRGLILEGSAEPE